MLFIYQYYRDFYCYVGIYMPVVLICVETNWPGG